MNWRPLILGSVVANLAFFALLMWQTALAPAPAPSATLAVTTNVITEVLNEPPPPLPEVKVAGSPPFTWSQIEHTNALVVATNLLAIGCPKETVRDLLTARIADEVRAQVRVLLQPVSAHYWDHVARGEEPVNDELKKQTDAWQEIKKQRLTELEALLGREPEAPLTNKDTDGINSHLASEKQAALEFQQRGYAGERAALQMKLAQASDEERNSRLKELATRYQAERRALFTEAEWAEAELRRSPSARAVRELAGYNATPEQLRALAQSLKEFADKHAVPPPRNRESSEIDGEYQAKLDAREAARKALLTEQLGAEGFAAFERGSDPRFQTLQKLARRLDLPTASAAQWLDLQSAAQNQARDVRANAALTDDAKAVALLAIQAEATRTLQTAVGARGWGAYQRNCAEWLKDLTR